MELHYKKAFAHQSWHRRSIRALLTALIDEHPAASDEEFVKLFDELAQESEEHRIAAVEYAVTETLSTLRRRQRSPQQWQEQRDAEKRALNVTVESIKSQIMLLNLEMPNGQRMRYCTGTEMGKWGKAGLVVQKRVGAKRVGEVLSEAQVRKIYGV